MSIPEIYQNVLPFACSYQYLLWIPCIELAEHWLHLLGDASFLSHPVLERKFEHINGERGEK